MEPNRVYGLGGYGRGKPTSASAVSMPTIPPGRKPPIPDEYPDYTEYNVKYSFSDGGDPQYYGKSRIEVESMKIMAHGLYCGYENVVRFDSYLNDFIGTMTYMENPTYFCIRSPTMKKWLEKHERVLHDEIEEEKRDLELNPEVNYMQQPCAVLYKGRWCRGFVMRTNWRRWPDTAKDYVAEVNLVDTGFYGCVLLTEMRELPEKWLKAPPMTYRAMLAGDRMFKYGDHWPHAILKEFHRLVDDNDLSCKFRYTEEKAVELLVTSDRHWCEFCKKGNGVCSVNEVITRMIDDSEGRNARETRYWK